MCTNQRGGRTLILYPLDILTLYPLHTSEGATSRGLVRLYNDQNTMIRIELVLRLAELANAATTSSEKKKYQQLSDNILEYVKAEDSTAHSNLMSDVQKVLDKELNPVIVNRIVGSDEMTVYDQVQQKWTSSSSTSQRLWGDKGNQTVTEVPSVDSLGVFFNM